MIYTNAPKFAFIIIFRPEKDIVNLKCRFSILRKAFDLLIDKTRFEKYLKYSILLLFFRFLTDDRLGHRGRTVNWPT